MRPNDDIDFTTLTWVKGELDETLKQAQQALEAYVEDTNDASQMRFCATYLHQVQGTLRMVELYGAAMVTEEMEQLASALLDGNVAERDEAYAVLMRGIVQLPDYLERLQSGHKDIPIVLLPLLNDLRAARGEKGLSEIVLFTPDLGRALPASAQGPAVAMPEAELRRAATVLRGHFQIALLKWFKNDNPDQNISTLAQVCDKLVSITAQEEARRLFWVAASVLDALRAKAFEPSPQLKQTIGKVEREIKRLADAGENSFRVDPPRELTRNLLYFVAHAPTEHGRIGELRDTFNLASLLPSTEEIEHARGSMSGHNRALLDTVSAAIKDDLMRVKDALDLYLRTQNAQPAELSSQVDVLDRVSDTLGMLGLGVARRVVVEQRDAVHQVASGHRPADESSLLDIAGALLYVEATLDDQVQHLGSGGAQAAKDGNAMPQAETRRVLEAVVKEAQNNFANAKQAFVAFIESNWDHSQLESVPGLMGEVAGAMRIVELPRPAQYLDAVKVFTQVELLSRRRVPAGTQMETLADVLASLEYFLEALGEHRAGREKILDVAQRSLEALGYWPVPVTAVAPTEADLANVDAYVADAIASDGAPVDTSRDPYAEPLPLLIAETPLPPPSLREPPVVTVVETPAVVDVVPEPAPQVAAPATAAPAAAPQAVAPPAASLAGFEGSSDEIDDEIREVFVEEVQEEIANLEDLLPTWKADPANMDHLKSIRRVFHTLKGSGRLVGALTLGEFSWKIESMLNRVLDHTIQPTPAVIDLVDHAFNALPELLAALRGQGAAHIDLEAIKAIADRVAAGEQVRYEPRQQAAPVAVAQDAAPVVVAVADTASPAVLDIAQAEPVAASDDAVADASVDAPEAATASADVSFAEVDAAAAGLPERSSEDAADTAFAFDSVLKPIGAEPASAPAAASIAVPSIDPVLFDILKAEVAGHLDTVDAYLADSAGTPRPINDALLRSIHTMNGAFAMTDVPVITDVLGPLEGYLKRLLAHGLVPTPSGIAALGDTAQAVRALMTELERPQPRLTDLGALAERITHERDILPEPGGLAAAPLLPSEPAEAAPAAADAPFDAVAAADGPGLTEAVSMASLQDDAPALDELDLDAFESRLDALLGDAAYTPTPTPPVESDTSASDTASFELNLADDLALTDTALTDAALTDADFAGLAAEPNATDAAQQPADLTLDALSLSDAGTDAPGAWDAAAADDLTLDGISLEDVAFEDVSSERATLDGATPAAPRDEATLDLDALDIADLDVVALDSATPADIAPDAGLESIALDEIAPDAAVPAALDADADTGIVTDALATGDTAADAPGVDALAIFESDEPSAEIVVTDADRLAWAEAARADIEAEEAAGTSAVDTIVDAEEATPAAISSADVSTRDDIAFEFDAQEQAEFEAELLALDDAAAADADSAFEVIEVELDGAPIDHAAAAAAPTTDDVELFSAQLEAGAAAEFDGDASSPSAADLDVAGLDAVTSDADTDARDVAAHDTDVPDAAAFDADVFATAPSEHAESAEQTADTTNVAALDPADIDSAFDDAELRSLLDEAALAEVAAPATADFNAVFLTDAATDTTAQLQDDASTPADDTVPDTTRSDGPLADIELAELGLSDLDQQDLDALLADGTDSFDVSDTAAADAGAAAAAVPAPAPLESVIGDGAAFTDEAAVSSEIDAFWAGFDAAQSDTSATASIEAPSDTPPEAFTDTQSLDDYDWEALERETRPDTAVDAVGESATPAIEATDADADIAPAFDTEPVDNDVAANESIEAEFADAELDSRVIDTATPDADTASTIESDLEAIAEAPSAAANDEDDLDTLIFDDDDDADEDAPPITAAVVPVPQPTPAPVADNPRERAIAAAFLAGLDDADPDPDAPLELADMDEELLDIFLEEGGDLLDHSDALMAKLRDTPEDRESVVGLQRDLHTLKGGARMAGIAPVGDLSHSMESLLEAVAEGRRELPHYGVDLLQRAFDRLHTMVTRVGERRALAMPTTLIERVEALSHGHVPELPQLDVAADTAVAQPQGAEGAAAPAVDAPQPSFKRPLTVSEPIADTLGDEDDIAARLPQEQIRIRADLLDRLVNYAGEVAIYRARLEQQLGLFRGNLSELEQTTLRLREQLRKLEIETEAQIVARYQREAEIGGEQAFDPLELDRFSTLQQLSRALSESAADIVNLQGSLDDHTRQYETLLLQQSRVSSDLQEGLMRTRMVPFDSLVPRLRRIIRQTGSELGKKAQLKVDGAQGEMDRNVLERMTAPLEHMLRNALAHGLELPEERVAAGKNDEGTVRVHVLREGSEVVIRVTDDGRGLDRDAIRRKAISRGLLAEDVTVSDRDLYAYILEPGFSTAETVSKIAGRGVGMDVVYSEIRQLGGTLQIDSERGKGSVFTIRLPFTLAVTQAVFVKQGETSFAVPIASVQGVARIDRDELEAKLAAGDAKFVYAGEEFLIHDMGLLLGDAPVKAEGSLQVPLLLARSGDQRAAICVDQVIGSREIVVKPVGPQVGSIPGIFGATIMGDGRVIVILDVAPLVRRHVATRKADEPRVVAPVVETRRTPLVMVVDDSITMRKVTSRVLERHSYEVLTAKDGVDAIEKLADRVPDVMLLDIEMPRMDGYELATHMRNDIRLRGVPIIMITSRTGEKHRQRAFEIGVDRYLGKPYQEAELMRNVQEILKVGRGEPA